MNFLALLDHVGAIASIVSLPAAILFVIAWVRDTRPIKWVALLIILPIAVAAYAVDIADRLGLIRLSEAPLTSEVVLNWGRQQNVLLMRVNSQFFLNLKDHYKLMLVLHIPYANIDRMTDTAIEKSTEYTITGEPINLAISVQDVKNLRVLSSVTSGEFSALMDFNLVAIPNNTSPEQIKSLSDIERVGGKIILTHAASIGFFAAPVEKQAG